MEKTYDLIIIGSGPAGLSAAIYAQRAGLDTLVLEKEYISGGQVVNTAEVDNYPGLPGMNGYELGMKFRSHADALEAKFQIAEVKDIIIEETQKTVRTNEGDFYAKNIIISTGQATENWAFWVKESWLAWVFLIVRPVMVHFSREERLP